VRYPIWDPQNQQTRNGEPHTTTSNIPTLFSKRNLSIHPIIHPHKLIGANPQAPCLSTTLQTTPFFLSDPAACSNTTIQTPLWACLQRSCDFSQQEIYYNLTRPLCASQPVPSRGLPALIEPTILGPLTLLAVATRLYSRHTISKCFGVDDYLIFVAGLIYAGTIVLYIFSESMYCVFERGVGG
jgi:hypothetical protein